MTTDYEAAIAAFQQADQTYKELEEYVSSGKAISDIVKGGMGPDVAQESWHVVWKRLQDALEDRNAKVKTAKDLLRASVQLTQTQWRGPDGEATSKTVGEFKVSSVTLRSFDANSLFNLINQKGRLQELLALTKIDKDGQVVPAVRQEWKFEFETVLNWLKSLGLNDVISGAYNEVERTPSVKGPKPVSFLGENKKDD